VPDLKDRKNIAGAIRKTFDTSTKQTVEYTSIAEGMPQRRSLTFLKHSDDIVIGIVRKLFDEIDQEKTKF
jgi:hypothetical protein